MNHMNHGSNNQDFVWSKFEKIVFFVYFIEYFPITYTIFHFRFGIVLFLFSMMEGVLEKDNLDCPICDIEVASEQNLENHIQFVGVAISFHSISIPF